MLVLGLCALLVLSSGISLWRVYRKSQASVRYLEGADASRMVLSSADMEPERWRIVSGLRTLRLLAEGYAHNLRDGSRALYEVVIALNMDVQPWLARHEGHKVPGASTWLELSHRRVQALWDEGNWGLEDTQNPVALAKRLDDMVDVLLETERRITAAQTPYRR